MHGVPMRATAAVLPAQCSINQAMLSWCASTASHRDSCHAHVVFFRSISCTSASATGCTSCTFFCSCTCAVHARACTATSLCWGTVRLYGRYAVAFWPHLASLCTAGLSHAGWTDGATAVVAWVLGETVIVANCGDARAVLARAGPASSRPAVGSAGTCVMEAAATAAKSEANGQRQQQHVQGSDQSRAPKAITLTKEHKAIFRQERERIQRAGGVVSNGRLDGALCEENGEPQTAAFLVAVGTQTIHASFCYAGSGMAVRAL